MCSRYIVVVCVAFSVFSWDANAVRFECKSVDASDSKSTVIHANDLSNSISVVENSVSREPLNHGPRRYRLIKSTHLSISGWGRFTEFEEGLLYDSEQIRGFYDSQDSRIGQNARLRASFIREEGYFSKYQVRYTLFDGSETRSNLLNCQIKER